MLEGNITNCPKGHWMHVVDGVYSATQGVLKARPLSDKDIRSLRQLYQDAEKGNVDQEQVVAALELFAPDLAPILKVAKGNSWLLIFAMLLWTAVELAKLNVKEPAATVTVDNRPHIEISITPPKPVSLAVAPSKEKKKKPKRPNRKKKHPPPSQRPKS